MVSRGKILLFLAFSVLIGCRQGSIFRPQISCEYPPQYGLIFVARDWSGEQYLYWLNLLDSDTVVLPINSFIPSTLFYSKQWSGVGYVDSSLMLRILDREGNAFYAIQFHWQLRMLSYDDERLMLYGVAFSPQADTVNYIFGFDLQANVYEFQLPLSKSYAIDTNFYFFDPVEAKYYISAKRGDTTFLLSVDVGTGQMEPRVAFRVGATNVDFDYNGNVLLGVRRSGLVIKLIKFWPSQLAIDSSVVLSMRSFGPYLGAVEQARQYYVSGYETDTGYVIGFYNIETGALVSKGYLNLPKIYQLRTWSAFSY